jgi:AcrR family transcriptional regulator
VSELEAPDLRSKHLVAHVAGDSRRARLLDATERLIGEHGVDGVSVRAINAAAESNSAAAHYHFGSKEGLVAAALERRMEGLAADRFEMLAPLERLRRPPVRGLVEALVVPLVRLCETRDGRHYVRFLATLARSDEPWRRLAAEAFAPQWARVEPVLDRALPDQPAALRRFRFSVAAATLMDVLGDPERHLVDQTGEPIDVPLVRALIDLITGVLAARSTIGR